MRNEKGFTLIELVVVIVILGVLAATALPRFVDLQGDARQAAIEGAAGALTSAMTINYSTSLVRTPTGTGVTRLNGANACATLIAGGGVSGWNADFTVSADAACGAVVGQVLQCTLAHADDTTRTAVATVICTG